MTSSELFEQAKKYLNETKFDEALKTINQCIVLDPQGKDNYLLRGEIYFLLEQSTNSLNDFAKVIELDPNNSEAHVNRGIVYFQRLKQNDLAIEEFKSAIEKDPKNADAFYYRGRTYKIMNQIQNALNDFNTSIKLAPDNAKYYYSRGYLYQSQNRYEEAIVEFNRCIEMNPNIEMYFSKRGRSYFLLNKFDLALKDFNKAIEINPNNSLGRANRAVLALNTGNCALALSDYYYIKEQNLGEFLALLHSKFPDVILHTVLTNYHKVKDATNKYNINTTQALALLQMKPYVINWILQTWRQLVTEQDINNKSVILKNNTPTLPPEIYRLITTFIMECSDADIDKLVWAVNKRLHDDVMKAHKQKISIKLSNSANKFLTLFNVKTKTEKNEQIAEERLNRRLNF